MGFKELRTVTNVTQIESCPSISVSNQCFLCHVARHCNSSSLAVLIYARLADDTLDVVPVIQSLS